MADAVSISYRGAPGATRKFIAQAILAEASLPFLGVAEPTTAWGLMLSGNAADFYREAP